MLSANDLWERILAFWNRSLPGELISYFDRQLLDSATGDYKNFSPGAGTAQTVKTLLLGFAFGIIIAAFLAFFTKRVQGGFVRALLREECFSPEKAKTLSELGFFASPAIRKNLSGYSALTRYVKEVKPDGEDAPTEKKIDFSSAKFYIPKDLRYTAEVRFEASSSGAGGLFLTIGLTVAAVLLICRFLSPLLGLADGILSLF